MWHSLCQATIGLRQSLASRLTKIGIMDRSLAFDETLAGIRRTSPLSWETAMSDEFLDQAIAEAEAGWTEGGIPIGSVLVHQGRILGRGHNRRVQRGSAILHGEMDALENAGRLPASVYRECVLYTTLSPCPMCSGTILLYKIPRVVIGENQTFLGEEELLRSRGVQIEVVQDARCLELMQRMIREKPQLWNEDIGV